MITIYTDGSSLGNPGPGGRGVIILGEQTIDEYGVARQRKKILSGASERTTNNRMELTAAIRALQWVVDGKLTDRSVVIFMDSMYVRDGLEKYLPQRIARGRRLANKKPVQNRDLREQLHILSGQCGLVDFTRVKAHTTNTSTHAKYNNEVDKLARHEATMMQERLPEKYVGRIDGGNFGELAKGLFS